MASQRWRSSAARFNPRPSRRTGATSGWAWGLSFLLVSILARPEGRALPVKTKSARKNLSRFNPRPSRRTGATIPTAKAGGISWFQSSPVPKDGRYDGDRYPAGWEDLFQSSPVPKDGRYRVRSDKSQEKYNVSILARPEGRALPASIRLWTHRTAVSILARPEGRALRGTSCAATWRRPCFNPRPSRRTGATF